MLRASMFPNLFRSIEIAKLGGHSVGVAFDSYTYKNGFSDFELIRSELSGWFDNFKPVDEADIQVELCEPSMRTKDLRSGLTLDEVKQRVVNASTNARPELNLDKPSESLMDNAARRLHLGVRDCTNVRAIAQTIAQFEGASDIKIEYVAEALNYMISVDGGTDAVYGYTYFGDGIRIQHGYLDISDIEAAIAHLEGLKTAKGY